VSYQRITSINTLVQFNWSPEMCTDCDYCGEIRILKDDGAGGKICMACEKKQAEFDKAKSTKGAAK